MKIRISYSKQFYIDNVFWVAQIVSSKDGHAVAIDNSKDTYFSQPFEDLRTAKKVMYEEFGQLILNGTCEILEIYKPKPSKRINLVKFKKYYEKV